MPLVRNMLPTDTYQPKAGEHLLRLANSGDVPLYIGIRNGEYMLAQPPSEPQPVYVLTKEQYVRMQQQFQLQTAYKNWVTSGLLTLVEITQLPEATEPPARAS